MAKDEVKSLVNSVNMVKNMVESIVSAVQERFKDYDNVVVSLKEKIENLENKISLLEQSGVPAGAPSSPDQVSRLEKRLDGLNERILLIEAARSVQQETTVEPADVQALKDIAEKETKPESVIEMPTAPITPPPTPEVITSAPEPDVEKQPAPPTVEAPPIPTPAPPSPIRSVETPEPAIIPAKSEIPSPATFPKPATQVTEPAERDVSPISKEVSGGIPLPPSQDDSPTQQPQAVQPPVPKVDDVEAVAPEEKKSAELFGEAVSGDKAELLKALKKLEDL
ncbi:MAG: hypothetical protein KAU62_08760 [Candidatus Heimdallarchaeota archaeon]|nr:hypothetical protein [Candidatus Heimdallarchaeota archaeon]MCG3256160.1 hypothetical protein [Candidatus Heimdallarchaeota archaeon]MCK4611230.1 hypothetical protein [Candidatus Heimdallarchaeota archaeon]